MSLQNMTSQWHWAYSSSSYLVEGRGKIRQHLAPQLPLQIYVFRTFPIIACVNTRGAARPLSGRISSSCDPLGLLGI